MGGAVKSVSRAVSKPISKLASGDISGAARGSIDPLNITGLNPEDKGAISLSGQPNRPGYGSIFDPNVASKMNLPENLKGRQILGDQGVTAIRERALGTQSPWETMMLQRNQQNLQQQLGQSAQAQNVALGNVGQAMARGGGVRGGFQAAIGKDLAQNQMMQDQRIRSEGLQRNLDVSLTGEKERSDLLNALVGTDVATQKGDVANALAEKRAMDTAGLDAWKTQMSGWAAGKQGEAIRKSGKK